MSEPSIAAGRLGEDLRASFNASNPKPIEYLELASKCLDRAKLAVDTGLPVDARVWLETTRAAFETAYKLEELMAR
jgi:hypothetical protein